MFRLIPNEFHMINDKFNAHCTIYDNCFLHDKFYTISSLSNIHYGICNKWFLSIKHAFYIIKKYQTRSNVMQFTLLIHMHFISLVNVRAHVTRNHLIILIISFNKKRFSVVIFLAIFHDHIKEIQKRWGYQFFCQKSFLKDLICLYVTRHFFYYRIKNFQHKALFYQRNLNLCHKVWCHPSTVGFWKFQNSWLLSVEPEKETPTKLNKIFDISRFMLLNLITTNKIKKI